MDRFFKYVSFLRCFKARTRWSSVNFDLEKKRLKTFAKNSYVKILICKELGFLYDLASLATIKIRDLLFLILNFFSPLMPHSWLSLHLLL